MLSSYPKIFILPSFIMTQLLLLNLSLISIDIFPSLKLFSLFLLQFFFPYLFNLISTFLSISIIILPFFASPQLLFSQLLIFSTNLTVFSLIQEQVLVPQLLILNQNVSFIFDLNTIYKIIQIKILLKLLFILNNVRNINNSNYSLIIPHQIFHKTKYLSQLCYPHIRSVTIYFYKKKAKHSFAQNSKDKGMYRQHSIIFGKSVKILEDLTKDRCLRR